MSGNPCYFAELILVIIGNLLIWFGLNIRTHIEHPTANEAILRFIAFLIQLQK